MDYGDIGIVGILVTAVGGLWKYLTILLKDATKEKEENLRQLNEANTRMYEELKETNTRMYETERERHRVEEERLLNEYKELKASADANNIKYLESIGKFDISMKNFNDSIKELGCILNDNTQTLKENTTILDSMSMKFKEVKDLKKDVSKIKEKLEMK